MVIGNHLAPTDTLPVQLIDGQIEIVRNFTYLGSNITDSGEVSDEVKCRISKAARAFGCLQNAIFQNRRISVETKKKCTGLQSCLYFCMELKHGPSKQRA